MPFSWVLLLFLNSTLLLVISYFSVWIHRTLQTVGPSHARTYTVAVYFKGERIGCGKGPRWVRRYNIIRHNRTRSCTSQCTANGLENNGCALLMVFIIAIKLLLAYSIGRDIMQNENESIHYWFDVNCVMAISLCAEWESVTRRHCIWGCFLLYLGYCVLSGTFMCLCVILCLTAHLLCALTHSRFCKVKKVNLCANAFSGLEGWQ